MSDRAKKISELTVVTSAAGNDRMVLVQNTSGNAVTVSITANSFMRSFFGLKTIKFANTNYVLTANDNGSVIPVSNTSSVTVTVPASLPVGFNCTVLKVNTGNAVIGNATGVTLNSKTSGYTISTQWGSAVILVYAANSVVVSGDI